MKAKSVKEISKKEKSKSKAADKTKKAAKSEAESEDDLFFGNTRNSKEIGNKSNKCRSVIQATINVTATVKR